jgi:hypothetical protein
MVTQQFASPLFLFVVYAADATFVEPQHGQRNDQILWGPASICMVKISKPLSASRNGNSAAVDATWWIAVRCLLVLACDVALNADGTGKHSMSECISCPERRTLSAFNDTDVLCFVLCTATVH